MEFARNQKMEITRENLRRVGESVQYAVKRLALKNLVIAHHDREAPTNEFGRWTLAPDPEDAIA
jgi:hypothetical protein